jgi:hypothetical protein
MCQGMGIDRAFKAPYKTYALYKYLILPNFLLLEIMRAIF